MSSKLSEFIDECYIDNTVDDVYDYPISGDEESLDEDFYMNRQRILEEQRIKKEKREAKRNLAYTAKINSQLRECGEVLQGKLCWLKKKPEIPAAAAIQPDTQPDIPTVLASPADSATSVIEEADEVKAVEKFSDIMNEQQNRKDKNDWHTVNNKRRYEQTKQTYMDEPRRYTRQRLEPNSDQNIRYSQKHATGVCKHIMNGDICPFGESCRFSHNIQPAQSMVQTSNNNSTTMRTRKIWMCKHMRNCMHGTSCSFAHSIDEVRDNVRKCTIKDCNRVVRHSETEYRNTVADHKCMRLHVKESIENFIKRTS